MFQNDAELLKSWKRCCKSNPGIEKWNLCLKCVKGLIVITRCLCVENLCFPDESLGLLEKQQLNNSGEIFSLQGKFFETHTRAHSHECKNQGIWTEICALNGSSQKYFNAEYDKMERTRTCDEVLTGIWLQNIIKWPVSSKHLWRGPDEWCKWWEAFFQSLWLSDRSWKYK